MRQRCDDVGDRAGDREGNPDRAQESGASAERGETAGQYEGDRRPSEAVAHADVVVVAIAAQYARGALEEFKGLIPDSALIVSLMKGIEKSTGKRMDQVVCEALDLPTSDSPRSPDRI